MTITNYFEKKKKQRQRELRRQRLAKVAKLAALGVTAGVVTSKLASETETGRKTAQKLKDTSSDVADYVVVMVSDGILDALPAGEQEHLLDLMIGGSPLENPEELANYILDKVLELAAGKAGDDMTVLVAGIWKMCYSR